MIDHLYNLAQDDVIPDGDPILPGDLSTKFDTVFGAVSGIGLAISTIAFVAAAVMLGLQFRDGRMGSGEGVGGIVKVLAAVVLIGAAPSIVRFFM